MSSTLEPEAFFLDLAARALATAKAAPALTDVMPLADRGWRLGFRVADGGDDLVEINALVADADASKVDYSYRPVERDSPKRRRHLERVGRLLCMALERVPITGGLPAMVVSPSEDEATESPAREYMSFWLEGECDRGCIFCSVSVEKKDPNRVRLPLMRDPGSYGDGVSPTRTELETRLRANAQRASEFCVEWSGKDCVSAPDFDDGLRLAHELGYRDMGIQTPGSRLLEPGFIDFLRAHSVVRVGLTAHAGDAATFDEVGGKQGAYRIFWDGFERLLAAGFTVDLEVPCVAKTVDGLPAHLAKLATYPVSITCFYWYPSEDMNDTFADIGMPFARAIEALEQTRELVERHRIAVDGVPECVATPELLDHFFWAYTGGHTSFIDFERVPACDGCAARERCPGAAPVYMQHYEWPGTPLRS